MKDNHKTKRQLMNELSELRQRIADVEKSEADYKRLEEALQESEEKYRKLFQEAMDAIFVADIQTGILIDCNRAASELVGREKSEVIGKHQKTLHPQGEIEGEFSETFTKHLKEKEGQVLQTRIITKNGEIKEVEIKANLIQLRGKTVLQGIFRDVTYRKLAEETLRDSEERYRTVIEQSADCIYLADMETRQILEANPSFQRLLGYSSEELHGLTLYDFVIHNREDIDDKIQKILNGRSCFIGERKYRRKDGSLVDVDVSVSLISYRGKRVICGVARNITERKRVDEALRQSERRYRNLVENIQDWVWEVDENFVFTYSSPRVSELLGYELQEVIGKTPFDFMIAEEVKRVNEITREIFSNREPLILFENHLIHKDGHPVFFETSAVPIYNEKGIYRGYRGICHDFTKRKYMEEALRESEEKFRAISDTAADAILVMDSEGKISFCNPAAQRMFGYTGEETMGKELHLFLAPERYHKYYLRGFDWFRNTGQGPAVGKALEFFAIRKDGTEFPIEVSTSAIRIKGKWHAVGIVRDITARKQAEQALRESEHKYRALFEESKDVVYISTPEGKFLDMNRAGIELFGYSSKEEILQIDIIRDFYANPEDRENLRRVLAKQGYVKDYEALFKRKDGELVPVLLTTTIVRDEKGRIAAYQGIMKDISERKRLEQQLLHAQKMEAVGQLAGGVAHDFNNLLTAIIGYGSFLQMNIGKDNPLSNYAAQILNAAERAANLTQALLAFSRKQIINPKPVNLNEIITGVKNLLSRLIGEDIELSTVLTEKDLTVLADSGQMEQVLMNLATNARDAMPDGGSLIIVSQLVELDNEFVKAHGFGKPGAYALISVDDTGHGMDDKIKERIFEPFFTTKDVGKGTGLGLAMVYGIIKQHDGYINVYSEPACGTVFKIYLPLINSLLTETKPASYPVLKGGIETVLIAEDDSQVRGFIKEMLKEFGYKVLEAADGEDAIMIFNENKDRIRLLVLDVIMPKKNGKEVYDHIKREAPDIKALFTSGYTSDIVHRKKILEEGLDFMLKPISPEELLIKVREILDR